MNACIHTYMCVCVLVACAWMDVHDCRVQAGTRGRRGFQRLGAYVVGAYACMCLYRLVCMYLCTHIFRTCLILGWKSAKKLRKCARSLKCMNAQMCAFAHMYRRKHVFLVNSLKACSARLLCAFRSTCVFVTRLQST